MHTVSELQPLCFATLSMKQGQRAPSLKGLCEDQVK